MDDRWIRDECGEKANRLIKKENTMFVMREDGGNQQQVELEIKDVYQSSKKKENQLLGGGSGEREVDFLLVLLALVQSYGIELRR